jgi:hypothetical protein
VLKDAPAQISSDARIQHVRTGPIRHDVNVKLFGLSHASSSPEV